MGLLIIAQPYQAIAYVPLNAYFKKHGIRFCLIYPDSFKSQQEKRLFNQFLKIHTDTKLHTLLFSRIFAKVLKQKAG